MAGHWKRSVRLEQEQLPHTSRCIPESSPAADRQTDRRTQTARDASWSQQSVAQVQERTTHCCYLGSGFFFFFFHREAQLLLDSVKKQEDFPAQSSVCSSFHSFHLYTHPEWVVDVTKCFYFNLLLLYYLRERSITLCTPLYFQDRHRYSSEYQCSHPLCQCTFQWGHEGLSSYAHKQMITPKHWLYVFQFPCNLISQVLH